jgi:catechol 2,3-dioxygenase-like lactoylglutathione lyase family enzyme
MHDIGITHIALTVSNIRSSVGFYENYANMRVMHERPGVVWISDNIRPFVIVLIETHEPISPLAPDSHLGIAVDSRAEVDRLAAQAKEEGRLLSSPQDSGSIIGYWCFLRDPDGHTLEISFGQEVGLAVQKVS